MPPKRKADAPPDPRQQGIAAAFGRRPAEQAAVDAGALRVEHFSRKLEGVTEMDDYSVNNVINEAGDANDEEERAGEGACVCEQPLCLRSVLGSHLVQSCCLWRR